MTNPSGNNATSKLTFVFPTVILLKFPFIRGASISNVGLDVGCELGRAVGLEDGFGLGENVGANVGDRVATK